MDILEGLIRFLKGINLKYEKNKNSHLLNLKIKDEPTDIEGSVNVIINSDESTISANIGRSDKET